MWEFGDSFDFLGIHTDVPCLNNETEERGACAGKLTFLCLDKESVLQQPLENGTEVPGVFLGTAGEDEDVVKVDED